jgi:hypothetical protein
MRAAVLVVLLGVFGVERAQAQTMGPTPPPVVVQQAPVEHHTGLFLLGDFSASGTPAIGTAAGGSRAAGWACGSRPACGWTPQVSLFAGASGFESNQVTIEQGGVAVETDQITLQAGSLFLGARLYHARRALLRRDRRHPGADLADARAGQSWASDPGSHHHPGRGQGVVPALRPQLGFGGRIGIGSVPAPVGPNHKVGHFDLCISLGY